MTLAAGDGRPGSAERSVTGPPRYPAAGLRPVPGPYQPPGHVSVRPPGQEQQSSRTGGFAAQPLCDRRGFLFEQAAPEAARETQAAAVNVYVEPSEMTMESWLTGRVSGPLTWESWGNRGPGASAAGGVID